MSLTRQSNADMSRETPDFKYGFMTVRDEDLEYLREGVLNRRQLVVSLLQTAFQAFPRLPCAGHPRLDLRAVGELRGNFGCGCRQRE